MNNKKVMKCPPSAWKKVKKSGAYYRGVRREFKKMICSPSPLQMMKIQHQRPITSIFNTSSTTYLPQSNNPPAASASFQSNDNNASSSLNASTSTSTSAQQSPIQFNLPDISDEHNYSAFSDEPGNKIKYIVPHIFALTFIEIIK